VLRDWEETLDLLENSPMRLAHRLDTYLKLLIFDHQLRRENYDWKSFHTALGLLSKMQRRAPELFTRRRSKQRVGRAAELRRKLWSRQPRSRRCSRLVRTC